MIIHITLHTCITLYRHKSLSTCSVCHMHACMTICATNAPISSFSTEIRMHISINVIYYTAFLSNISILCIYHIIADQYYISITTGPGVTLIIRAIGSHIHTEKNIHTCHFKCSYSLLQKINFLKNLII